MSSSPFHCFTASSYRTSYLAARRCLTLTVLLLMVGAILGCGKKPEGHKDDSAVLQELREFEAGRISLDELTVRDGESGRQRITDYYEAHSNQVSPKMLVAVSRCYAGQQRFLEAAVLAERYVGVYSNDYRGWRIVGGANLMLGNPDQALWGQSNAFRLGDPEGCRQLAGTAFKLDRWDVIKHLVPELLRQRYDASYSATDRAEMLQLLVAYAAESEQIDILHAALTNLPTAEFEAVPASAKVVLMVCEAFDLPKAEAACELARVIVERQASKLPSTGKEK